MNLEDLQSARNRERRTDSLQPLQNSFYDDAAAFVYELRQKRDEVAAAADDPFDSPDVRRLTNSIKTAENTVEAIYERRVGKVVKLASLDAAGMTTDDEGLTPEERDLFGTLTAAIERNRRAVIDGIEATDEGETDAAGPDGVEGTSTGDAIDGGGVDHGATDAADGATEPPAAETGVTEATGASGVAEEGGADVSTPPEEGEAADAMSAADVMGVPAGTTEPSGDRATDEGTDAGSVDPEPPTPEAIDGIDETDETDETDDTGETGGANRTDGTDRETIRITRDVGEIVGIDERVYDLASEDVVTLPAANAKPLVDRNAAERLE